MTILALLLGYGFLASYPSHVRGAFRTLFQVLLEPISIDWVSVGGIFSGGMLHGVPLVYLDT